MASASSPPPDLSAFQFLHDWWAVIAGFIASLWYMAKFIWVSSKMVEKVHNDMNTLQQEVEELHEANTELVRALKNKEFCVPCPREDCPPLQKRSGCQSGLGD